MKTATQPSTPESLADVCEVEVFAGEGVERSTPPGLLIEVPHGATRRRHFAATRRCLEGEFPDDLEQFFFVNTDVGSIECARWVARMATRPARFAELGKRSDEANGARRRSLDKVLILRGLVARTFIDLNRVLSGGPSGVLRDGLTPGLPAYVRRAEDVRILTTMHGKYQTAAAKAHEAVCGAGGSALILHTYAPRSVRIDELDELDELDESIVAALRRAYEPENYARCERRPAVDQITESVDGERLAPESLVRALQLRYAQIGIAAAENATYRLHEDTMAYVHSVRHPGRVLCLEISRELLTDSFTPFAEMSINERQARRMAAPIAAALLTSGTALQ